MKSIIAAMVGLLVLASPVLATEVSSTNFTIKDPVIDMGGGFASSASFGLRSVIGGLSSGISSGTGFGLRAGFLFFTGLPEVPGSLAAVPVSAGQINLSWSDSSTNEDGFKIERKMGAGGTYAEIASVAAGTAAYPNGGLSAATTYFYRVRAFNVEGNSGYSNEIGATTQAASSGSTTGGGGGGGGGGGASLEAPAAASGAVLIGRAYPLSAITVLVDGAVKASGIADASASFNLRVEAPVGIRSFSIYATDPKGRRSLTYSFTMTISSGTVSSISGIFLAPTIDADKSEVKKGDAITILGQTAPSSTVSVVINSEEEIIRTVVAGRDGTYLLVFDTDSLERGDHSAKSRSLYPDQTQSPFSASVNFKVGDRNVGKAPKGDINQNGRVNIVDFSVLLYWWGKTSAEALRTADINNDGRVSLTDLSVLLYYWTG